jgi:parallel beta-helix repeat protein
MRFKELLLILVISQLIIGLCFYVPIKSNGVDNQTDHSFELSEDYVPHDRISITSDEMFSKYDFPGEGTTDSPFLIQGLNITTISTCIFIQNTSKHVLITNCWLKSGDENFGNFNVSTGIYIYNVTANTVSVSNNILIEGRQAVHVKKSNGVLISDNNLFDTRILTDYADNIQILNNELNQGYILIMYTNHSEIKSNLCFGGGIDIWYSFNLTIYDNLAQNAYDGIYLFDTHNSLITWNKLINNEDGIVLAFSSNNLVHHNTFTNNTDDQAVDIGSNNTWYDPETLEGNWWSDYNGTGVYTFNYDATDYYPLLPLEESSKPFELITIIVVVSLVILGLSTAVIVYLRKRNS